MIRLRYTLAAAGLSFLIGVFLTSILDRSPLEQPPCRACGRFYVSPVPLVSICELKNNRAQYEGKVVRVRADFHHDAGLVNLTDHCGTIHTGFSDLCKACGGAVEALTLHTGFGSWYDGTARVVVFGRIGPLENPTLYPDKNGFNIDCLESVEATGSGTGEWSGLEQLLRGVVQ